MNIISNKDWEMVTDKNRTLIEKWQALQYAHQHGSEKEILTAEMQYLSALQNLNAVVEVALSEASRKSA